MVNGYSESWFANLIEEKLTKSHSAIACKMPSMRERGRWWWLWIAQKLRTLLHQVTGNRDKKKYIQSGQSLIPLGKEGPSVLIYIMVNRDREGGLAHLNEETHCHCSKAWCSQNAWDNNTKEEIFKIVLKFYTTAPSQWKRFYSMVFSETALNQSPCF